MKKKLALSTTFEEWFISKNRNKSMLRGCLSDDIEMLEHSMILEKFLPQLTTECAYCFENDYCSVSFKIKVLRENYLYTVGCFMIDCSSGYSYRVYDDGLYSKMNGIDELFDDLFCQMLAYYEKYNIGTDN